ncbi:T22D1 protein, partial [Polyodon spathula]|nr:T22D1 protein [Polyodon spathula]
KKKSGFQITSVTPAHISASTNNSITEDTESYDDLDESHTEDLSSSEILDVSLSRATDMGGPERSSSEETLNNFHEVETPGAVSPNQHLLHQSHHQPQPGMPSGMNAAAGTPVNVVNPVTSNVNNVSVAGGSSASVPGLVGTSSSNGSSSGAPPGLMNLNSGLTGTSNPNVIVMQQQQGTGGAVTMNIVKGACSVTGGALSNVISGASGDIVVAAPVVVMTTAQTAPVATPPSQQQAPPPTSSRFRVVKLDSSSEPFKKGRWICTEYYDKEPPVSVAVASATSETVPSHRAVESIRQTQPDTTLGSERESTSGSSVSSTISTLSHYTESVGSGEMGAPSILQGFQQPQVVDYGSPQSLQASLPGLPQSVSQPQLAQAQIHSQEVAHSLMKTSGTPSVPSSIGNVQQQQPPMNLGSIQTSIGLPTATIPQQQQLPYTQQPQQPATAQMFHPPLQQQAAPTQMASEHVMPVSQGGGVVGSLPPEFVHQQIIQPPMQPGPPGMGAAGQSLQHVPHIPGTIQPPPVSGNGQMMGMGQHGGNIPPGNYQTPPQGILQQQQTTSPPQGGILHQILPGTVSGLAQQHHQSLAQLPTHLPVEQQQQSMAQGLAGQQPCAVSLGQVTSNVPLPAAAQSGMPPSAAQPLQNGSMIPGGGQPTMMPASSAASTGHYLALRPFSAAQLEDARRLLLQDQTLLSLPKLAVGDGAANSMSAFAASASLFPLKTLPLAGQVVDGEEDSSSGASVVAIDNKIEQAMDLVKSHLMYAVREEVEVLKEQIKELIDRNSQLEQENNLLKNLASPEQLAQFQAQLQSGSPPASSQQPGTATQPAQPSSQSSGPSA